MKKIIKSDWTMFILGLVIILGLFIAVPKDIGAIAIAGTGIVFWVALFAFRLHLPDEEDE